MLLLGVAQRVTLGSVHEVPEKKTGSERDGENTGDRHSRISRFGGAHLLSFYPSSTVVIPLMEGCVDGDAAESHHDSLKQNASTDTKMRP